MAFGLVKQLDMADAVQVIDIALDDALFSRYGVTIPVLKYNDSELNWPFDLEELKDWLGNNGVTYHP